MKRKIVAFLMASVMTLASFQVQTVLAEDEVAIEETSESEVSDAPADEEMDIEDQPEISDESVEIVSNHTAEQDTELPQDSPELSDTEADDIELLQDDSAGDSEKVQNVYNDFSYHVTDENEIMITGYDGDTENGLIIPDTINGCPVTEIGAAAFAGREDIKGELKLPEKLERIGRDAFSGCYNLTGNLIFPSTLKEIDQNAFERCKGFTGNLILPEGLETIGEEAFYGCTGYRYEQEDEHEYGKEEGFSGLLIIPSTVTFIGDNAFKCKQTDEDYWFCDTYFYRIENHSDTSLDMTQVTGIWYDLERKIVFTNDDCYLRQGTAVLVPYVYYVDNSNFLRIGEREKVICDFNPKKLDENSPTLVEFNSSDSSIARVDKQGVVEALGTGTVTITAVDVLGNSFTDTIEVIGNKAEVKKGNLTWYIPEEIGLGYQVAPLHSHCMGGISIVKAEKLPPDSIGKGMGVSTNGTRGDADDYFKYRYFMGPHAADGRGVTIDSSLTAYSHKYYDTAVHPGMIEFQAQIGNYDSKGNWVAEQNIGEKYTVKIKTPSIVTNEPKKLFIGDSFVLTSSLKDTALHNDLVSSYKRENSFYHTLVYQPTFEVIQGADLIDCTDGDFSHMLTASEKISFKKAGTVKIKIKYNPVFLCSWCEQNGRNSYYVPEKTVTLKIEEPVTTLGTVKLGKVKSAGYNRLSLTWSAVPDATGYIVYRKSGKRWKKIAVTSKNSYKHISSKKFLIKTGETYLYTVKAYRKTGKTTIYGGYNKRGMKGKAIAGKPVLTSISSPSYNQVRLTWKKTAGATGYIVYRKNSKNKWERVAVLKGNRTSYTHISSPKFPIIKGKTYTYTVRSYTSEGRTYGRYDSAGKKIRVR